jgi:hypothetical protein
VFSTRSLPVENRLQLEEPPHKPVHEISETVHGSPVQPVIGKLGLGRLKREVSRVPNQKFAEKTRRLCGRPNSEQCAHEQQIPRVRSG